MASYSAQLVQCKFRDKYVNFIPDQTMTSILDQLCAQYQLGSKNTELKCYDNHNNNLVPFSPTTKIGDVQRIVDGAQLKLDVVEDLDQLQPMMIHFKDKGTRCRIVFNKSTTIGELRKRIHHKFHEECQKVDATGDLEFYLASSFNQQLNEETKIGSLAKSATIIVRNRELLLFDDQNGLKKQRSDPGNRQSQESLCNVKQAMPKTKRGFLKRFRSSVTNLIRKSRKTGKTNNRSPGSVCTQEDNDDYEPTLPIAKSESQIIDRLKSQNGAKLVLPPRKLTKRTLRLANSDSKASITSTPIGLSSPPIGTCDSISPLACNKQKFPNTQITPINEFKRPVVPGSKKKTAPKIPVENGVPQLKITSSIYQIQEESSKGSIQKISKVLGVKHDEITAKVEGNRKNLKIPKNSRRRSRSPSMGIIVKEQRSKDFELNEQTSNDFELNGLAERDSNEEHIYENLPKLSLGESDLELPESIIRTTTAESTPATQPRSIQVTPQSNRLSFSDIKISKSVSDELCQKSNFNHENQENQPGFLDYDFISGETLTKVTPMTEHNSTRHSNVNSPRFTFKSIGSRELESRDFGSSKESRRSKFDSKSPSKNQIKQNNITPVTTESFKKADKARCFERNSQARGRNSDRNNEKRQQTPRRARVSIKVAPIITPLNVDSRVSDRVSEEF